MKRQRGFTLIELLAVILILGIIALIAIPVVSKIILQSKKGAFEASINNIIRVIDDTCQEQILKGETITTTYTFTDGVVSPSLNIKGKLPTSGTMTADASCNVSFSVTNGIFTATKTSSSDDVTIVNGDEVEEILTSGIAVYFNPETGRECDATSAVSTTGTNSGCMKWYIFNDSDTSNTVNLILDHNTTAKVAWNSTGINVNGPSQVITQLQADTSSWTGVPMRTDSYSVSNEAANYVIDYSTYNARLITADEVAKITNNTSFSEESSLYTSWFYLDNNNHIYSVNKIGASKYDWLFDYTYNCTSFGCNISDDGNTGYWASTSVAGISNNAWGVGSNGSLGFNNVNRTDCYGVRPVITIDKSLLINGKAVYFNPVSGTKCTEEEAVSTTGTNSGCMKWYAFNYFDASSTVNLILDHNTTALVAWNSTNSNVNGPNEVLTQLKNDTSLWTGVPTRTDSYSVSNGTANYNINYDGYKARLITAGEIATIVGKTGFNEITSGSGSEFCFDSKNTNKPVAIYGRSKYAWLFDYTCECIEWRCNIADSSNYGYWTSTAFVGDSFAAWDVSRGGALDVYYSVDHTDTFGVRPVITISKSLIS